MLRDLMLVASLTVGFAGGAQAGDAPPSVRPEPTPLSADEMSAVHAGSETRVIVMTDQQVSGVTSGNTITAGAVNTGAVGFAPGALSGFAGIGNFVINTGANNTLQGSINISIVTAPPS